MTTRRQLFMALAGLAVTPIAKASEGELPPFTVRGGEPCILAEFDAFHAVGSFSGELSRRRVVLDRACIERSGIELSVGKRYFVAWELEMPNGRPIAYEIQDW